jgi:hypothetical protein
MMDFHRLYLAKRPRVSMEAKEIDLARLVQEVKNICPQISFEI